MSVYSENGDLEKRWFRLLKDDGTKVGRYCGKNPKQAANKAFTSLIKDRDSNKQGTNGEYGFTIVETTRYGPKRGHTYKYKGKRTKLDNKNAVQFGGGKGKGNDKECFNCEYKFKNTITAVPNKADKKK